MNFELFLAALLLRSILAALPLLLATLGEIVTERSGIMNLGVEGMMAAGAVVSFGVALASGSALLAILAGMGAAMVLAALHSLACIVFRANQTVSGLAITMIGLGLSGLAGRGFIGKNHGLDLPALASLEPGKASFLSTLLAGLDLFLILSTVLTILIWFFLRHTRTGILLKTCGENPRAAEAQGIPVEWYRFWSTLAGGALSGLAGTFLALSYSTSWNDAMTGGRGWIAVALTIFALWNPLRAVAGSLLFGSIFVLQYALQPLGIQSNFLALLPYLTTLVIMVVDGLRTDHRSLGAPAALGELFKRGER